MAKPAFKPNKERPSKDLALAIARGEPLPEDNASPSSHAPAGTPAPIQAPQPASKKTEKPGKSVSLNMQVSQATWQAISYEAIGRGISRKLLIMDLLQQAGINIDAADLSGSKKGG